MANTDIGVVNTSPLMLRTETYRRYVRIGDNLRKEGSPREDSTELFEAGKEGRKWTRRIKQLEVAHEEHDAEFEMNDQRNRNVPYVGVAQDWYNKCREKRIKAGVPVWEPLSGILGVMQLGFDEIKVLLSLEPLDYESIPLPEIEENIRSFVIGGGDSFLGYTCHDKCYDDVLYIWSSDQMYILGKDLLWKKVCKDTNKSVLNDVSVWCGQGPIA